MKTTQPKSKTKKPSIAAKPTTRKPNTPSPSRAKQTDPKALRIGQTAPAFTLPDGTGKKVSLSNFKGKKVVLYFYPKDDTPGCTKEACSFRDGLGEIKKNKAVVLGVSADSVESHKKFLEKYQLNFPLLSDQEKKVVQAYGVWKEKSLYGRKFMGIERSTFVIDEAGKIAMIFPKVKVDSHLEEVLSEL